MTICVCKSSVASKYSRVRMPAAGTSDAVAGLKCRRAESGAAGNGEDSLRNGGGKERAQCGESKHRDAMRAMNVAACGRVHGGEHCAARAPPRGVSLERHDDLADAEKRVKGGVKVRALQRQRR